MKKSMIALLILILCVVGLFAGCTSEDRPKVEGTIHNQIVDEKIRFKINVKSTGQTVESGYIAMNSSEIIELERGNYRILAYDSSKNFIDGDDLTIGSTDTTFTIIVDIDSVSAYAT